MICLVGGVLCIIKTGIEEQGIWLAPSESVYYGRKDQPSRSIRPPFTEKMITFHGGIDHLSRRGNHPQSFSL